MKVSHKLSAIAVAVGFALSAQAITIPALTPSNGSLFFDENQNLTHEEVATELGVSVSTLTLVYKAEVDGGGEFGSAAGWYSTLFTPLNSPKGATITHDDGDPVISGPSIYLVVKDGTAGHYWWNISGWDGYQTLSITDLYPDTGSISHVRIYTGTGTSEIPSVPDGGLTVTLLGSALLGLGVLRRKLRA